LRFNIDTMTYNPSSKQTPLLADAGMHVEIELILEDGLERMAFDLVDDAFADFAHGFLGLGTPLAQAIYRHPAGSQIPYRVGDARLIRILSVTPSSSAPPEDVAQRRQETFQKAIDQSDRTNAMIFASSFSGKWGDYDPTGFTDEDLPSQADQGGGSGVNGASSSQTDKSSK
jgi:hypothetical protein